MAGIAVVAIIIALTGIVGMFGLVVRASLGIRREDRLGTLYTLAPCRASRFGRRLTGMGARLA
jgi:hypothetical protein